MGAEIRTRKNGSVRVLVVYWRDHKGKRHTAFNDTDKKPFGADTPENRARAEAFRAAQDGSLPQTAHSPTLIAWTKTWLQQVEGFVARGEMSPISSKIYKRLLRLSILSHWIGKQPISTIKPVHVKEWATDLMKPKEEGGRALSTGSARLECKMLHRCLEVAIEDDVMPRPNPAFKVIKALKLQKKKGDSLAAVAPSLAVTAALLAAVDERAKGPFAVMIFLGLRVGEALGLQWTDIDLEAREVKIERQVHRDGTIAPPKSRAGSRIVEIPEPAIDVLKALKAKQGREAMAVGRTPTIWTLGWEPAQSTAARSYLGYVWKRAAKKIGYKGRVWVHGVRHTYGTSRVNIGGEKTLVTLKNAMGHSSIQVTIDLYAKYATPRDQKNADEYGQRVTGSVVSFKEAAKQS